MCACMYVTDQPMLGRKLLLVGRSIRYTFSYCFVETYFRYRCFQNGSSQTSRGARRLSLVMTHKLNDAHN